MLLNPRRKPVPQQQITCYQPVTRHNCPRRKDIVLNHYHSSSVLGQRKTQQQQTYRKIVAHRMDQDCTLFKMGLIDWISLGNLKNRPAGTETCRPEKCNILSVATLTGKGAQGRRAKTDLNNDHIRPCGHTVCYFLPTPWPGVLKNTCNVVGTPLSLWTAGKWCIEKVVSIENKPPFAVFHSEKVSFNL